MQDWVLNIFDDPHNDKGKGGTEDLNETAGKEIEEIDVDSTADNTTETDRACFLKDKLCAYGSNPMPGLEAEDDEAEDAGCRVEEDNPTEDLSRIITIHEAHQRLPVVVHFPKK